MASMRRGNQLCGVMVVAVATCMSAGVQAASSPLDFAYQVTGVADLRPLLVFNDGTTTFIQPQDPNDPSVLLNGVAPIRQGPYYVVLGVLSEITLTRGKRDVAKITYAKAPARAEAVPADVEKKKVLPAALIASSRSSAAAELEPAQAQKRPEGPVTPVGEIVAKQVKAADQVTDQRAKPTPTEKIPEPVAACKPKREYRDTAFVATFKANSTELSFDVTTELKKLVGTPSNVQVVEVVAEGVPATVAQKRAESLRRVLLDSGVEERRIVTTIREPGGVGSEIHVRRTIEIPCDISMVKVPSKRSAVSIVWDGQARDLAARIAGELKIKFAVQGSERPTPVKFEAVDLSFDEAMERFATSLGDRADLILRHNELILSFKDDKK